MSEKNIEQKIAEWKGKYSKVAKYTTADGKVAYFRNPSIQEMEASTAVLQAGHPIQSNKVLAKATFLDGDTAVYEEPKYLIGLGNTLGAMVEKVSGEFETL